MSSTPITTARRKGAEAAVNLSRVRRWYTQPLGVPPIVTAPGSEPTPPTTPPAPGSETPPAPAETWDVWLGALPEAERTRITALYDAHSAPLVSALKAEREQRKVTEANLRELKEKAEKGSDSEKRLTEMVAQVEAANRRADFTTEAVKPENGITDLLAAWAIVNFDAAKYLKQGGGFDFKALREAHPTLFKAAPPRSANAGAGTQTPPPATSTMNDFIRRAAGRPPR